MSLVFVYGTLKKGFGNHRLLINQEFKGHHVTSPEYTMVSLGGFPGVIQDGRTSITGEVYSVTEEAMKSLDRLEGYPRFYDRVQIATPFGDAWMYTLGKEYLDHVPVTSGVWNR